MVEGRTDAGWVRKVLERRTCLKLLGAGAAGLLVPACGDSGSHGASGAAAPPPPAPPPPAPPPPAAIPAAPLVAGANNEYRFSYPDFQGILRAKDRHGFELTAGADGQAITPAHCLNLEHYFAAGRAVGAGVFVPRNHPGITHRQVSPTSVEVTVPPAAGWDLTARITYTMLPDRVLKAVFAFTFNAAYPLFEAFISTYALVHTQPYVGLGGGLVRQAITHDEHKFWPKGAAEQAMVSDGRYDYLLPYGVHPTVTNDYYNPGVMLIPTSAAGWYLFNVIERANCAALHANMQWGAWGDFSFVGRDVAAGETVTGTVHLVYAPLAAVAEALDWQARLAP